MEECWTINVASGSIIFNIFISCIQRCSWRHNETKFTFLTLSVLWWIFVFTTDEASFFYLLVCVAKKRLATHSPQSSSENSLASPPPLFLFPPSMPSISHLNLPHGTLRCTPTCRIHQSRLPLCHPSLASQTPAWSHPSSDQSHSGENGRTADLWNNGEVGAASSKYFIHKVHDDSRVVLSILQ